MRVTVYSTSRPFDLNKGVQYLIETLALGTANNARELLSGTTSSLQLRRDGHPYGRNPAPHGGRGAIRGTAARLPINYQSGDLWRHLWLPQTRTGFSLSFPGTPSAWVLADRGTRTMAARGYAPELLRRVKPVFRKTLREVVPHSFA